MSTPKSIIHDDQKDVTAASETGRQSRKAIEESERSSRQMSALASVLQITDRIMAGRDLNVRVEMGNTPYPAWTDGETIMLNGTLLRDLFKQGKLSEAIMTFKGTNYHELAHCLYSPRPTDPVKMWMQEQRATVGIDYQRSYNVLEDQRIETMYTATYSPTTPYFQMAVFKWMLFDVSQFGSAWPMLVGRKFIPRTIRDRARQAFVNMDRHDESIAVTIESIVNEYITLPLPAGSDRACELIKLFHDLVRKINGLGTLMSNDCGGGGSHINQGEIDPNDIVEASEAVQDILDAEASEPSELDDPSDSGSGDDDSDDDDSDSDGEPGSGESDDDGMDDESDEPGSDGPGGGDSESDGDSGSGSGSDGQSPDDHSQGDGSNGQSDGGSMDGADEILEQISELLRDEIEDALGEVLTDPELARDIERTTESFHAQVDKQLMEGSAYNKFRPRTVTNEMEQTVERIVEVLLTLQTDLEPQWNRDRINGRIDPSRLIRRKVDPTLLEVFQEWDEGNEDDATVEVVIALDLSGSMGQQIEKCSQAMWTLKRAFDRSDITTTVLGFSDDNVVLYKPSELAHAREYRSFQTWSGTNAQNTMKTAHRILAQSGATNRILVAITDGSWETGSTWAMNRAAAQQAAINSETLVSAIRRMGVHTLLFCLDGRFNDMTHNFETVIEAANVSDIVAAVQKVVTAITLKAGQQQ